VEYLEIIAMLGIVAYAVIEMRHGRATDQEIRDRVIEIDARQQWAAHEGQREAEQAAARIGQITELLTAIDARIDANEREIAVLHERTRRASDGEGDDD